MKDLLKLGVKLYVYRQFPSYPKILDFTERFLYPDNQRLKGFNLVKYISKSKLTKDTSAIPNFFSSLGVNFTTAMVEESWYDDDFIEATSKNVEN